MSFDCLLDNRTPFDLQLHVQTDAEGQEVTVLMLSASFTADAVGRLALAEAQLPVAFADVPHGDPARGAVLHDADIAPVKPVPEVILAGALAHAPGGRPAERLSVGLQAGAVRKVLSVVGDRFRLGPGLGPPEAFLTMPVTWERARGGTAPDGDADPRNPVGIGHAGARSADPQAASDAPNVLGGREDEPAGLGVVSRGWRPRLDRAGTFDEAWLAAQWPLAPRDMDPLHHQAAPDDQRHASIGPGADVVLVNLTPEGRWAFRVPRLLAPLRLLRDDRAEEAALVPDTLVIEPERRRLTLKARLALVADRRAPRLREAILGHVTPLFLQSRLSRKAYLGPHGGTHRGQPVWAEA